MATRSQKVKLGAFVLGAGAVAIALVVALTQLSLFSKRDQYFVLADSAEGLHEGSAVAVRGVTVGEVEEIALFRDDYESVTIVLSIERGIRINADASAFIEFEGVTGRRTVNIHGGSGDAGALEPGSYIPHKKTLIEELPDRADRLLAEATLLLESTNSLVRGLGTAAEEVDMTRIDSILEDTARLAESVTSTSEQLNVLVREVRGPLVNTLGSADATFEKLDRLVVQTDTTAANLDRAIALLANVVRKNDKDISATLKNLRRASSSFDQLARELRMRPGLLLFGEAAPERKLP